MIYSEASDELELPAAGGRGPAGALVDRVSQLPPSRAAAEIKRVLDLEDGLAGANLLAPYADLLPVALVQIPSRRLANALGHLPAAEATRALFGSFRALPSGKLAEILAAMGRQQLAELLEEMAIGYDLPRTAARLLTADGQASDAALLATDPEVAARMTGLMPHPALRRALTSLPTGEAGGWLGRVLAVASPWEVANLLGVLEDLPFLEAAQNRAVLSPVVRRVCQERDDLGLDDLLGPRPHEALRDMPAVAAGTVLCDMAVDHPALAGFLLSTMADLLLVRRPDGELRRVLHGAPGAAVLATFDPDDRRAVALVSHADTDVMAELASRLDRADVAGLIPKPERRTRGWRPVSYPATTVHGSRRSRSLGHGRRWVQLREQVIGRSGSQPLRVDLVELDLTKVRLRACRVPDPDPPISAAVLTRSLSRAGRGGSLPAEEALASLGLVRLAQRVSDTGAVAGINGSFYFDYGHCLDAQDLGLDLSEESGLNFGDLVGWFVSDGETISPALFGRAVLAVTADGRAHVRRVSMTDVTLASGRRLRWDAVNRPGSGRTILYDGRAGRATPRAAGQVDVVVVGTEIAEILPGGGARIPLLGFVLSLSPVSACEAVADMRVGDPVQVGNDFPSVLGWVEQAMACGPQLVRAGQIDVDLDAEGFGEKDSSVLPLSLTRAVDSFRAARSFVFTRSGRLTLGVVSGTQLGSGPPRVSVGVTFGELAQLCVDLGAEDAVALDGGGSSSVVARIDGGPEVLSVPTGGGDVPEGVERFLKTYWLAFAS